MQWATYRDASDQTSLSRIWGGIHPPADDIPGRIIGEKIGIQAFNFAEQYFKGAVPPPTELFQKSFVFPNPISNQDKLSISLNRQATNVTVQIFTTTGQLLQEQHFENRQDYVFVQMTLDDLNTGVYILQVSGADWKEVQKVIVVE